MAFSLPQAPPPSQLPQQAESFAKVVAHPALLDLYRRALREHLPWDDVRHQFPQAIRQQTGIIPQELWAAVKLGRGSGRPLPLHDPSGKPFVLRLPDSTQPVLHVVDREGGNALHIDVEIKADVLRGSLIEEAIASSQIEGAAVTRADAKEMIRAGRDPRSKDERMILNNYRTILLIKSRLKEPMTVAFLHEIQSSMTAGTLENSDHGGRFRRTEDRVVVEDAETREIVFEPPPAARLDERMAAFLRFVNSDPAEDDEFLHPLVKAAIIHFWFAYEHPYCDGNGRTARALLYWSMLRQGYWLFEFLSVSRVIVAAPARYYRSFLHSEADDNDVTYSVMYVLSAVEKALGELRREVERRQADQYRGTTLLQRMPDLNERQRALLVELLRAPRRTYTVNTYLREHGVSQPTAWADLQDLARRGLLIESRAGRAFQYAAVADLADRVGRV